MPVASTDKANPLRCFLGRWRIVLLVAVLSLSTMVTACYVTWQGQVIEHRRRFQQGVDSVALQVNERLKDYEIAMEMARGLFLASDEVTLQEWRSFTTSEHFYRSIPGTHGFAYVQRVPADKIDEYVQQVRKQGNPEFNVFDTNLYQPADYDDYGIIRYNEPISRNASTIGLNVASIPASADAMRRSMSEDRVAMSRVFKLHQVGRSSTGIAMYLPIHDPDADSDTPQAHARSVIGWVAMPIEMSEFIRGLWPDDWATIDGALYQHTGHGPDELLFSSCAPIKPAHRVHIAPQQTVYQAVIPVGNWQWLLKVRDPRPHAPVLSPRLLFIAGTGGIISLLLVLLTWSLTRTRDRANQMAELLTESLRASEQRYALAMDASNDGLWEWDLTSNRVYYAPRWLELLGLATDQVTDEPETWLRRITSTCLPRFHSALIAHIRGETERFDIELQMHHADGSTRWMLCRAAAIRDDDRQAVRIAGSLADITDLKLAQDELRSLAHHDQLTGLANRVLLTDRLNHAIARARRSQDYRYALLFLDFDRFKVINDSLGHGVGDRLLAGVAERIRCCVRDVDTVARFGGDEFVVLMDGILDPHDARILSQRLLDRLSEPFDFDGCEVVSTVSIGVVDGTRDYHDADEVIRDADAAMYQAKAGGRARFCQFDAQMHTLAVRRMKLEQDLRLCRYDDQFQVFYQPIVNLSDGTTTGFEALLRWEHPEHGHVSPDEFIPIAEESGLIVELGVWVLNRACKDMAMWRQRFDDAQHLSINVNLSRRQLLHPELLATIRQALHETQLPASALKLEITESAVMDNPQNVVSVMNRIRELGVRLAMDDFGTGHSSLSCLHKFPIDQLKIDRSFIHNMQDHREFAAVMDAIVTLAHFLRLQVIAEGIENADQLSQLQAMDCQFGQGYYFARPMPLQAATDYIAGYRHNAIQAA